MGKYPEHDKLSGREQELGNVSNFLEFIENEGLFIGRYLDNEKNLYRLTPVVESKSFQYLIAKYFDIDEKKFEEEKKKMLEVIRQEALKERG